MEALAIFPWHIYINFWVFTDFALVRNNERFLQLDKNSKTKTNFVCEVNVRRCRVLKNYRTSEILTLVTLEGNYLFALCAIFYVFLPRQWKKIIGRYHNCLKEQFPSSKSINSCAFVTSLYYGLFGLHPLYGYLIIIIIFIFAQDVVKINCSFLLQTVVVVLINDTAFCVFLDIFPPISNQLEKCLI